MVFRVVLLPFALVRGVFGLVARMLSLGVGAVFGLLRFFLSHTIGAILGGVIGFLLGRKHVGFKWGSGRK